MQFYNSISYNKIVNFPVIKIGNNKINKTYVAIFLGMHLDKRFNIVNHITEMSIKRYEVNWTFS